MFHHKYNLIFEYNKMTDSLITGNTTSLILYELRKINETLSKTKEEHTLNFRMIKPTEKFNFSEPILNSSKLGLIGLSFYNSVFNVNRRNNQFIYDIKGETWSDTRILGIISGAYELFEIEELLKEETNGNVIIESDKNTMKSLMEVKQGAINFDIENSIALLLGFRKLVYEQGKNTSQKIVDIMGFSTINIHCNEISGVKDNGNNTDILYTFTLTEPPGYLINIITTDILYQNETKDRIEYIEFHFKDEHGSSIYFNGDVLNFTLHLV